MLSMNTFSKQNSIAENEFTDYYFFVKNYSF
ncbi:hypothetical protein MCEGE10_00511 [Flavobacteriaceae bacterium]